MKTSSIPANPYRTAVSFFRSLMRSDETSTDPFIHRSNANRSEMPIEAIEALRS
jgi:hypothetical protein